MSAWAQVLPSLQSFCVFAAVGILAVYFIQATWFVAWFTLDQRRIEARRDGLLPCYTHRRWTPNECSQRNCFQNFFSRVYAPAVLSRPGKVRPLGDHLCPIDELVLDQTTMVRLASV